MQHTAVLTHSNTAFSSTDRQGQDPRRKRVGSGPADSKQQDKQAARLSRASTSSNSKSVGYRLTVSRLLASKSGKVLPISHFLFLDDRMRAASFIF
jgi:hypothetical protein